MYQGGGAFLFEKFSIRRNLKCSHASWHSDLNTQDVPDDTSAYLVAC